MEMLRDARRSRYFPCFVSCGVLVAIGVLAVIAGIVWLASGPESGVKMTNEMDKYALDYIDKHKLLNGKESLIAYYDETMRMDGSEAAILTTEHVMYHKNGRTTSIPLKDINDIQHRYESLTGDIIDISSRKGMLLKIEIAPMNEGVSFYNALLNAWKANGGTLKQ